MFDVDGAGFSCEDSRYSSTLQKYTNPICKGSVALIRTNDRLVRVNTHISKGSSETFVARALNAEQSRPTPPLVINCKQESLSDRQVRALDEQFSPDGLGEVHWKSISLKLSDGSRDSLAFALEPDVDLSSCSEYIERIWPVLREDCLSEQSGGAAIPFEAKGGGWKLLDEVPVGVLILDGAGLMYRLNLAGRRILEEARILRRSKGGIFAAVECDNELFRRTLFAQSESDVLSEGGALIFVHDAVDATRVPITISRFVHEGIATRFVVATLPVPILQNRIETLGRKMGLTTSEARVAALIQKGLSNRNAAEILGLKEQTFNTYAKRVLSKLDVSCRTEMAQLLTWQVSGGRLNGKC